MTWGELGGDGVDGKFTGIDLAGLGRGEGVDDENDEQGDPSSNPSVRRERGTRRR